MYGIHHDHMGMAYAHGNWYGGYNPYHHFGRRDFWSHNMLVKWTQTGQCGITKFVDRNVFFDDVYVVHFPEDFVTVKIPESQLIFNPPECTQSDFHVHLNTQYTNNGMSKQSNTISQIVFASIALLLVALLIGFMVLPFYRLFFQEDEEEEVVTEYTTSTVYSEDKS